MANGYTTQEEQQAASKAYDDVLVQRYIDGLPLGSIDKKDARRIIKERSRSVEG